MKKIPLTCKGVIGKYALVDDIDVALLEKYKWYSDHRGYAFRTNYKSGKYINVRMHRLIMDAPKGMEVDHINRDKLDNRRSNLRICTRSQNQHNQKKNLIPATSIYRGVHFNKKEKIWKARIKLNTVSIGIGNFKNEHWAAMAYDIWARELHGEFAGLNFPLAISNN